MKKLTLNVLLGKAEHTGAQYLKLLKDYFVTFKNNQGIFQGLKKTYEKLGEYEDEPKLRGHLLVQNTVKKYLEWMEETCGEHVSNLFAIEATNASGTAKANLVVDGKDWGSYSTPELMRLNHFLNGADLLNVYGNLPVRSDTENWVPTTDSEYKDKGIFESTIIHEPNRTTLKVPYILPDPNIDKYKDLKGYQPVQVTRDTPVIMGNGTRQKFSGELSHLEKAEILRRLTALKAAVKQAIIEANHAEVIPSELTAKKIFGYLHHGK